MNILALASLINKKFHPTEVHCKQIKEENKGNLNILNKSKYQPCHEREKKKKKNQILKEFDKTRN